MGRTLFRNPRVHSATMAPKGLSRDRAALAVLASGTLIVAAYLGLGRGAAPADEPPLEQILTVEPWYCEVRDPTGAPLVVSSVETFHAGGRLEGRTRLEDRAAGRVLLEFSYRGLWQLEDTWLTEAINAYEYLHVDDALFTRQQLAAIEAEFAEPEVSRIHALTRSQLVYGAERSLYLCHREGGDTRV